MKFESIKIEGDIKGRIVKDIRKSLLQRIEAQIRGGRFQTSFDNKYHIALTIDKGGDHVVFGLLLGSCSVINSPDSMLLAGILKGDETYQNLKLFQQLYDQLKNLQTIMINGQEIDVLQFLVSDIKIFKIVLGLRCNHSKKPCCICEKDAETIFAMYNDTIGKKREFKSVNPEICQDNVALISWIDSGCIIIPFLHFLLGTVPKILKEIKLELMKHEHLEVTIQSLTEDEEEISYLNHKINEIKTIHQQWSNLFNNEPIENDNDDSFFVCDSSICIAKIKNVPLPSRVPRANYTMLDVIKYKKQNYHSICECINSNDLKSFVKKNFKTENHTVEQIESTILQEIKHGEAESEDSF